MQSQARYRQAGRLSALRLNMGRPRCDPFDMLAIIADLDAGKTTPLKAYQEYASVAARPYARSTFDLLLQQARRGASRKVYASGQAATETQLSAADQDAASDSFWANHLPIKAHVLTTVSDNASLRVKGGALIVQDGERRLVFEAAAPKPRAIVMSGWSGILTIEAMRFACDHKIALILLDWSREFLNIVSAPGKTSAELVRCQVRADPVVVARTVIAQKLDAYVRVGAIAKDRSKGFAQDLECAHSVRDLMIVEAQAARVVWPNVPTLNWRVGSPRVLASWKLPYSTRRRMAGPSARRASHPINAMLNAAFSVTAGRLAAQLVAQGAHPALGFLHADKPGRWSLAYDAIEPLRPMIERRVFDFVRKHQFGANDFILTKNGSIRLMDNLFRTIIADTAVSSRTLDGAINWLITLIGGTASCSMPRNADATLLFPMHRFFQPLIEEGLSL
jgi:CRISP-associated protein Cas1